VKNDAFNELLESVRQAGAIKRGEQKALPVGQSEPNDNAVPQNDRSCSHS